MSDPKRLMNFSGTDEVSSLGRELLGSLEPSAAERERVLGRVMVSAGLVAGASAAVALTANTGAAALGANASAAGGASTVMASAGSTSLAAKLGLLLIVAAPIAGGSVYWIAASSAGTEPVKMESRRSAAVPAQGRQEQLESRAASREENPSPPHQRVVAMTDEETAAPSKAVASNSIKQLAGAESFKQAPPQTVPRASRASSLVEEDRLLREARHAAKLGDTKSALSILHTLDNRFPGGVLMQERELLKISVLNQAGRSAQAKERAEEFRQQFPDSPYDSTTGKK